MITNLTRKVYSLTAALGLKQLAVSFKDTPKKQITIKQIEDSVKKFDSNIQFAELDSRYYTTSWDNLNDIIDCAYTILSFFPWIAEVFDCDNRSAFVTVFVGMVSGVNCVADAYVNVTNVSTGANIGRHWCNISIDENGNTYLSDIDNRGLKQKINVKNPVMGNWKYEIISLRLF